MDPVAVLFNPSSGRGKSLKKRVKLEAVLKQAAIPYEWFSSRSEQHMRELARSLSRDFSTLIIGGGDTSFRIVAAEIMAADSDTALAFVGIGSANDITRSLGNDRLTSLSTRLQRRKTKRMDVGKLEVKGSENVYFLGNLSLGLGVEVNRFVAECWQRHAWWAKGGNFTQLLTGFSGIHNAFKKGAVPFQFELRSETGAEVRESSLLIFSNIAFYAGGLKIAPGKTPFDGKLNCCMVKSQGFFSTLRIGMLAARGQHLNHQAVKIISGGAFELHSETQIDVQVDGDVLPGGKQINIRILPAALTILD